MCKKISKIVILILSMGILLMGCSSKKNEVKNKEITISIAASLKDPIEKIKEEYEKNNNVKININAAGSGTLKKQISEGAEVDIFFSASKKYVDQLIKDGLVLSEDRSDPIKNSLVLIKNKEVKNNFNSLEDLKNIDGKIAIGEWNTVPAGEYAKESLENINIFSSLEDRMVLAKDVKAVKTYVENSDAEYGFIYKSDSLDLKSSEVVLEVPNNLHKEISYSLALINSSSNKDEAKKFINFMTADKGKEIFNEYGFTM
ncbi:molybdate ABC transporter substrate-binding protein [Clostridium septicum]|uniref:Molybdate ABC transporter substrate-binding protein n=1 Tax=Clostridium septicum TaxID=1504 RepID=A0ABY5B6Z8_CLOSE|nr:molybdate ABC transporter substrate-binding protein [Clostridium septicum]QAS61093.1 molybdate ABC transporter substrate-binding protein [Clostridium septicum]UEC19570.1 molybdate ABC transporter substrate-binding protein [Clostridium septicum]USS02372.1 molybdate ABC transporter substrate-binding protein [Clostridium septicum]